MADAFIAQMLGAAWLVGGRWLWLDSVALEGRKAGEPAWDALFPWDSEGRRLGRWFLALDAKPTSLGHARQVRAAEPCVWKGFESQNVAWQLGTKALSSV